jgi:hypothetical protein
VAAAAEALKVLVRVEHPEWHVDIEVQTPETKKLLAAKWVQAAIKKKSRKYPVTITERGNVLVRVS